MVHLVDGVTERKRIDRFWQPVDTQRSCHTRCRHRALFVLCNVFLTALKDLDREHETL